MALCQSCTSKEARFRQMAPTFEAHVAAQTLMIKTTLPPISPVKNPTTRPKGRVHKLASLGTAALIFAVALLPWTDDPGLDQIPEPSAIVNSVDTYGSSVMIIETANTQHTIIWFSET